MVGRWVQTPTADAPGNVREYDYFNYSSTTTSTIDNSDSPYDFLDYAARPDHVVFQPHRLYFDYSSRLVSTRKLVENGFRTINK